MKSAMKGHTGTIQGLQLVLYNPAGLEQRAVGPFAIEQVHVNGSFTIQHR
jgi:hypothetical protein